MTTIRRKRIYYAPGIITLAVLPFFFIYYAHKEIKARTLTAIPIFIPSQVFLQRNAEWFPRYKGHFPPNRTYSDIILTGDNRMDNLKLTSAQSRIRAILAQNDSLNGLHFVFGDNSQYGTFIKALDLLRIEDAKTYMVLDNNLWFYHFPPDTSLKYTAYPCVLCNDVIEVKPKISWWEKTSVEVKHVWHYAWQLIIAFPAFVFVTIILRPK